MNRRQDKTINIAVIDDGIGKEFINIDFTDDSSHFDIHLSHGMVCSAIISKYSKCSKLYGLRVLNDAGLGDIRFVRDALEWCYDHDIHIINMSAGSTRISDIDFIAPICNKLYKKGVIIVAAQSNDCARYTIPASFPQVLGVEQSTFHTFFGVRYPLYTDIVTKGVHTINIEGREFNIEKSNSFACAYATALVANMMLNGMDHYQIRESFKIRFFSRYCYLYYPSLTYIEHAFYIKDLIYIPWDNVIFRCIGLEKIDQLSSSLVHKVDLVIDSSQFGYDNSRKISLADLERVYDRLHSIVYCGKVPSILSQWAQEKGIYIYSYQMKKNTIWCRIESPLVYILGTDEFILYTMSALKQLFTDDRYNVVMISCIKYAYLYGHHYAPQYHIGSTLRYLNLLFNPDVFFVGVNDDKKKRSRRIAIYQENGATLLRLPSMTMVTANINELYGLLVKHLS